MTLTISMAFNIALLIAIGVAIGLVVNYQNQNQQKRSERANSQFEEFEENRKATVFLGDSLMEGGLWSEYFQSVEILNRGISGNTTQDVLDRLPNIYAVSPKRLFLMIGVNDQHNGISLQQSIENITKLFDGMDRNLSETQIFVHSILPVGKSLQHKVSNQRIKQVNLFLQEESRHRGYTYIDLSPRFEDKNGFLKPEYSNDGVHLLGAGYREWKTAIHNYVVE